MVLMMQAPWISSGLSLRKNPSAGSNRRVRNPAVVDSLVDLAPSTSTDVCTV